MLNMLTPWKGSVEKEIGSWVWRKQNVNRNNRANPFMACRFSSRHCCIRSFSDPILWVICRIRVIIIMNPACPWATTNYEKVCGSSWTPLIKQIGIPSCPDTSGVSRAIHLGKIRFETLVRKKQRFEFIFLIKDKKIPDLVKIGDYLY